MVYLALVPIRVVMHAVVVIYIKMAISITTVGNASSTSVMPALLLLYPLLHSHQHVRVDISWRPYQLAEILTEDNLEV